MRGLVTFIAIAAIGGALFVWQKRNEEKTPEANTTPQQQSAAAKPALTAAPRGQASEHNWMKRSLDRAADVADQSRARAAENQR